MHVEYTRGGASLAAPVAIVMITYPPKRMNTTPVTHVFSVSIILFSSIVDPHYRVSQYGAAPDQSCKILLSVVSFSHSPHESTGNRYVKD